MIIIKDRLREIFDTLPPLVTTTGSFKPVFDGGHRKELNAFLKANQHGPTVYPLIWLVEPLPYPDLFGGKMAKAEVNLALAVKNKEIHMLNAQREMTTYASLLYPLRALVERAIEGSGIAYVVPNSEGSRFIPSDLKAYGVDDNSEHYTTDPWDAILLSFTLVVNACKLQSINY